MGSETLILLLLAFLGLSAIFSASETALFAISRPRLRRLATHGGAGGDLFRQVLEVPHRVLVAILLGNTLANVAATATGAILLERWFGASLTLAGTVLVHVFLMSFIVLVFCEVSPKTYALEHGERSALRLAPILRIAGPALRPVASALEGIAHAAARLFGGGAGIGASLDDLRNLVERSEQQGTLSAQEAQLFRGAFRMRKSSAADVMTRRADLIAATAESTTDDLVELVNASGHSRIPIYEQTLDRVVGVVEAGDLLPFVLGERTTARARDLQKPPLLVSPARSLEELLRDMQRQRAQLAVVARPSGEALGIVTVEDVIEELVGEIQSEFEEDEPAVRLFDDGSARVLGRVRVSDVNRMLGTVLPSEDGDTVEMLVTRLWPEPPSEGDERVAPGGDRIGIESLVGGRVWSVRIAPASAGERS